MKNIKTLFLCCMLAVLLFIPAVADEPKSGNFKDYGCNISWIIDNDWTLTIRGEGSEDNHAIPSWYEYRYEIERIVIEDGITIVPAYFFCGLINIEYAEIPDTVEIIGERAFEGCQSLNEVAIPDSVKTIGSNAFARCDSLVNLSIPNGVERIESSAFGWSALQYVDLPESVTYLGDYAFFGCDNLESITIPASLKILRTETFYYCQNLKSVEFLGTVNVIDKDVFLGCNSLTDIYYAGNESQWNTIRGGGPEYLAEQFVNIHFESEDPDTLSLALSAPAFGATIPLTVSGSGTRTVNILTAFYSDNGQFVGLESACKSVYPGLSSIFLPITRWQFVPSMRTFALDDAYRPLSPAGQAETVTTELSDKYADILSKADADSRDALIDELTEVEAKDFIRQFTGWLH